MSNRSSSLDFLLNPWDVAREQHNTIKAFNSGLKKV